MNYLYQLRGLLDDGGRPHLDFSRDVIDPALNEKSLVRRTGLDALPHWLVRAPLRQLSRGPRNRVAKHCDGGSLTDADVPMVRIDARTAAGPIDWNANGSATEAGYFQDINFNGRTTATPSASSPEILQGFDDWSNIRLNQVGARRNVGGPFFDRAGRQVLGPLSISMGRWDFGRWDFASSDLGRWDFGVGDASRGDLGQGDYGRWDFGRWDFGRWDFGRWDFGQPASGRGDDARGYLGGGDMFVGDPNNTGGELDFETAVDLAKTPPNEFGACVIGVDCVGFVSPNHQVRATWTATNVGGVAQYVRLSREWPGAAARTAVDACRDGALRSWSERLLRHRWRAVGNGALYTYFTLALYNDVQSDPSNLVTITAVNEPPAAGNDSFSVAEDATLNQAAPGVLANDDDPDTDSTLTAALVTGPSHGTLVLNANGSFTYTPAANYSGTDSFTYKANDGTVDTNTATVTITVTPVNDTPTISDIADQTIALNTSTGALGFTIGDDVSGVCGSVGRLEQHHAGAQCEHRVRWHGDRRTVTVTPAPNQSGTATITVTVTDSGGITARDSFVLTVRQALHPCRRSERADSDRQDFQGGQLHTDAVAVQERLDVVDSAQVVHVVSVRGPLPGGPIRIFTNTDPGSSWFRSLGQELAIQPADQGAERTELSDRPL